jgi:hypothetical protein
VSEPLDPKDLDFASLSELDPDAGPAWQAAIAYGLDPTLIERNLQLSPAQRLQQNSAMLRLRNSSPQ